MADPSDEENAADQPSIDRTQIHQWTNELLYTADHHGKKLRKFLENHPTIQKQIDWFEEDGHPYEFPTDASYHIAEGEMIFWYNLGRYEESIVNLYELVGRCGLEIEHRDGEYVLVGEASSDGET